MTPARAGCATSLGGEPVIAFAGGVPAVGERGFAVRLLGAPQYANANLSAGLSNETWEGFALPLELGFVRFPGCELLVAPGAVVSCGTGALGEARFSAGLKALVAPWALKASRTSRG